MNKEQWLAWLEEQFIQLNESGYFERTAGEMVANIFDITTYDSDIDRLFAEQIVEVLEQIANRTTFEYIKNAECYVRYLTVVNFKGVYPLLNWGGSIRGAWFDANEDEPFEPEVGLDVYEEVEYLTITSGEEMGEFVRALRLFLNAHPVESEERE